MQHVAQIVLHMQTRHEVLKPSGRVLELYVQGFTCCHALLLTPRDASCHVVPHQCVLADLPARTTLFG